MIRLRSFFCINMRKERMPMAVTRRIPMHMNKGKNHFPESGRQNGLCEESGEDGQRWTGHDPMTVDKKFMLFKRQYEQTTDRRHRGMKWLLTRFVSPSSPARSHRRKRTDWGRNWLSVLQKVSMPSLWQLISIDRSHVHKHIVFNSTSIDGTRKFKNFWLSSIALQKVSNRKTAFEDSISIIWSDHNSEITKKQVQSISVCTKKQIRDVVSELLSESGGLYIND